MRFTIGTTLWSFLAATLLASNAAADPYTILPNGDLIFNVSVTTQGSLGCFGSLPCTGSGSNAVTLWSGSEWATFTFTGASASAGVGNVTVPMELGTIVGTSSPGFAFPSGINPNATLFDFSLILSQSSPVPSTSQVRWGFGSGLSRFGGMSYLQTAAGPNPPGYAYPAIIFTLRSSSFQLSTNGTTGLIADVGAVPEPASIVLLATGLGGVLIRRRRRSAGAS